MNQMVSRWLLPLVLVFGLVGNAAANGQERGHGSTPSPLIVSDSDFFIDRLGDTFGTSIDFKIKGVTDLITLKIATFDLEDMTFSIFKVENKKTGTGFLAKTFSFDDVLNASFSLDPGRYFAFFTGTVSSDLAGYAAAASAVPVPEPAEWMMIMAGVAMMGFVVSRRRNG